MNKSKQKLIGFGILVLILAGYTLLPPELQLLIQPGPEVASSSQNNPEGQRLNGREGNSQQLEADSHQSRSAKPTQSDSTVRNPTNVNTDGLAESRKSEPSGPATLASSDDSTQQTGTQRATQATASENHSTSGKSRGPPATNSEGKQRPDDNQLNRNQTETLLHGLLHEISNDQYLSPAGLIYGPGSAEGHRLDHLQRHVKDQPKRPGKHGVFDGGMQGALKTIDDAYQRAQKQQRTTKTVDRNRTIYTVDLGKRIGFVGGQDGGRRRNPMARRVRLVLEGKRVITAYPM